MSAKLDILGETNHFFYSFVCIGDKENVTLFKSNCNLFAIYLQFNA